MLLRLPGGLPRLGAGVVVLRGVLRLVRRAPPPQRDRTPHGGRSELRSRGADPGAATADPRSGLRAELGALREWPTVGVGAPEGVWINRPVPVQGEGAGASLNSGEGDSNTH